MTQNYNNVEVGFGDHSLPESLIFEQICSMALGPGASVIEKHLTLSEIMKMEDFEAAVNPDRFALFVINLRTLDKALTSNLTDFNVLSEERRSIGSSSEDRLWHLEASVLAIRFN